MKAATFTHYKSSVIVRISIHAAREGGDDVKSSFAYYPNISIHAAREGGDFTAKCDYFVSFRFQSTPPVKAATH